MDRTFARLSESVPQPCALRSARLGIFPGDDDAPPGEVSMDSLRGDFVSGADSRVLEPFDWHADTSLL